MRATGLGPQMCINGVPLTFHAYSLNEHYKNKPVLSLGRHYSQPVLSDVETVLLVTDGDGKPVMFNVGDLIQITHSESDYNTQVTTYFRVLAVVDTGDIYVESVDAPSPADELRADVAKIRTKK